MLYMKMPIHRRPVTVFTDRKRFWELLRYFFTDFGPKILIYVTLAVLTVFRPGSLRRIGGETGLG